MKKTYFFIVLLAICSLIALGQSEVVRTPDGASPTALLSSAAIINSEQKSAQLLSRVIQPSFTVPVPEIKKITEPLPELRKFTEPLPEITVPIVTVPEITVPSVTIPTVTIPETTTETTTPSQPAIHEYIPPVTETPPAATTAPPAETPPKETTKTSTASGQTTTRGTKTTQPKTTTRSGTVPALKPAAQITSYLLDSDNDCFSDRTENKFGTNPKNADSRPKDENKNCFDEAWEQKYGLIPVNSMQDTDQDGLSDRLEYMYETDPKKTDTDSDSFADGREILDFRTNPNDGSDPGTIEKLGIRITGFGENQAISDPQPFIKGVALAGTTVEIRALDSRKKETIFGRTITGENNMFLLRPAEPLKDGEYDFTSQVIPAEKPAEKPPVSPRFKSASARDLAATLEKTETGMESKPVHLTIKKALKVIPPNPQKLADIPVTEENLIKDLRVEIIDSQPVLFGKTAFNSEVVATWNSIVLTSAIIADSPAGEFSISPFHALVTGDHEVYLTAVRLKDEAASETIKLPFTVKIEERKELLIEPLEETPGQGQNATMIWVIALAAIALVAGIVMFLRRRSRKERK